MSVALPMKLKELVPVCCHTRASTPPGDSPGRLGVSVVADVGYGTVRVVLPVSAVARACASSVLPRMKFTTGSPNPRAVKPLPVIVKLAGGTATLIKSGVMALTPRGLITVSVTLPARLKELAPVCCQTCAWTLPTESPGTFGVSEVACVGNGTVNVVLPESPVARACAITTLLRTKFTTGRPKPRFASPPPVTVKFAAGVARSTGFGVMPLTPGTDRVSVTVSVKLTMRLKVLAPVCCHTCACTCPAESPGTFGVSEVACVGYGTVNVVLPESPVARACAISTLLRTKFTTGKPKPRFANPLPVIVKLAGGVARSIVLGVMPLTPAALLKVAVTACAAFAVMLQVPVPAQLPLQPVKAEPIAGAAVKVTTVPEVKEVKQVEGQEMPAGALVTVPLPAPAVVTVSANEDCMKVAVTEEAAFSVTVQVLMPVQPPPLQPLKVEPAAGVAVKVTAVPLANAAEHVAPHDRPAGALVTVPLPAPAFVSVSAKV